MLVVLAVFGLAVLWTFMSPGTSNETYTYSQLLDDVAVRRNVESITQEGTTLTVKLVEPGAGQDDDRRVRGHQLPRGGLRGRR